MMRTKLFIFMMSCILTLIGFGPCSESDEIVQTTTNDRVLVIYDNWKKEVKPNPPVTLWRMGLNEKLTAPQNFSSDEEGKIHLSLHAGRYKIETAYIVGETIDNSFWVEITNEDQEEIVIPLDDMRPYYVCSLMV